MAGIHPIRTRLAGDIVAEIVLPERQTGKIAIVAIGLPSSPSKGELLRFLAKEGYVAVFPRYRGTWESGGYFLDHSPAKDIHDVIESLVKAERVTDLFSGERIPLRIRKIHLFGTSFGGPAVILSSRHSRVEKVVALSSVIDWREEGEEEPFDWHVDFVSQGFGGAYRLRRQSDWKKLIGTDFYNPALRIRDIDPKKIFIIHAKDDRIVPCAPLLDFVRETGVSYYLKPKGGHTLRLTHRFLWNKIEHFLQKSSS